ncbi:MAG: hypothetical protein ABI867_26605 [Kofleriaceae bacterium]
MRSFAVWIVVAGCSGAPAAPAQPPVAIAPDAASDAPAPDAGIPAEVANAPAWIFRYHAADRLETWTLRYAGEVAVVEVVTARGTTRYTGTITGDATLALAVASPTAKLALQCKRNKLAVGLKCGEKKPKSIEVLDCFHPDFASPMSFAPAPGVEYSTVDGCNGYRLLE